MSIPKKVAFKDEAKYIYYLAQPYTAEDEELVRKRYEQGRDAAATLFLRGWVVFAPIAHGHDMAEHNSLPKAWEWWERIDRAFIRHCDGLIVLMLEGWRNSRGVTEEIKYATELQLPIHYLNPETMEFIDEEDLWEY